MSNVVTRIFGGSNDDAQRAQQGANAASQEYIERMASQGRGDVLGMTPGAIQSQQQGFANALGVLQSMTPQQISALQQGSSQAQAQLGSGAQQFQNAILGLPVDYSTLQTPRSVNNYDLRFLQNASLAPLPIPMQDLGQQQGAAPIGATQSAAMGLAGGTVTPLERAYGQTQGLPTIRRRPTETLVSGRRSVY